MSDEPKPSVDVIYAAIGENYRYFLGWRAQLLAGYFALMAALTVGFSWLQTPERKHVAFLVPATAAFLTVVFWMLEIRNRAAYRAFTHAGAAMEAPLGIPGGGGYQRAAALYAKWGATHSRILNVMFGTFALTLAIAAWIFWRHAGAF